MQMLFPRILLTTLSAWALLPMAFVASQIPSVSRMSESTIVCSPGFSEIQVYFMYKIQDRTLRVVMGKILVRSGSIKAINPVNLEIIYWIKFVNQVGFMF